MIVFQVEREFVGIEINPEYYAAAKTRLENTRAVPYTVQDGLF